MAYTIRIEAEAERDLADGVDYYNLQRPGLGDEFLDRMREAFALLKQNPFLSAKLYKDIRQSIILQFPYVVSYLVEGDRVVIIAVFHGHRDPKTWQSRIDS